MSPTDGGPAFPRAESYSDAYGTRPIHSFAGMSLRDYFAGQVIAGVMAANPAIDPVPGKTLLEVAAVAAYVVADAMLKAREVKP